MKDSVCKVSEENHQLEMPSCPLKYFFGICIFISMSVRQLVELCNNGSVVQESIYLSIYLKVYLKLFIP